MFLSAGFNVIAVDCFTVSMALYSSFVTYGFCLWKIVDRFSSTMFLVLWI